MFPLVELAEQLITPRTRVLVHAPLFGTRTDCGALAALCRRRGVLYVQDLAQAFDGAAYKGDAAADVAMFSFGTIKTATALGGALMTVRDPALRARVRALHAAWPVQPALRYARKCAFYIAVRPPTVDADATGLLDLACRALGSSQDELITRFSRSFPGPRLVPQIEIQPCAALLRLLLERLRGFDDRALRTRIAAANHLRALLPPTVALPGGGAPYHNYWVFPVLAADRAAAHAALRRGGIDSTVSASQLHVVAVPPALAQDAARAELATPHNARFVMQHLLYVPAYHGVPTWALYRIADIMRRVCTQPLPPWPRMAPQARL
jgi:dTDP-4-amino-4,6-dideoxygalactose transaminase